jgi:cytosine/adenosine deaminase-related metal-dependent hydrolase/ubiquinone/menaquinone biosynthesis C-methylase UbiE
VVNSTSTRLVSAEEGYRRWSANYDSQPNPMLSLEQRYLESLLPPIKDREIVDLGCGTGRWLDKLSLRSPRSSIGIDSSVPMLSRASAKLGQKAVLLYGNCERLPLVAESTDIILCSFVLGYVLDLDRFAEEVHRIGRAGADVFITDLHPETQRKLGWQRGFREGDLRVEVETCWRPLSSIFSAFEQRQFTPVAFVEPTFGAPEFAILRSTGKSHLIDELSGHPAIYILHLKLEKNGKSGAHEHSTAATVEHLRRCRIALGPSEDSRAEIRVEGGRIASIDSRVQVSSSLVNSREIDLTEFLVLPGLINSHDHLEFALFPRLGKRTYTNFLEWAQDIHKPEVSPVREHRAVPKDTRLWWGGIRNLLSGVTTVCHHNLYTAQVFENDFPIRVMRDFGWAHSIAMDGRIAEKHADTPRKYPFVVHLAEGVDAASADELTELDQAGALSERTVIVHGLALRKAEELSLLNSRGAALVWCPSSNKFLFGQTHPRRTIDQIRHVALGSDSSLTACGDLLDEIRFAREEVGLSAADLYPQVTSSACEILKLRSGEGLLRVGAVADLIAIRDKGLTPAEALASCTYRDIELVIVGGFVQLASEAMKSRLSESLAAGLERLAIDGEVRWIRAPLTRLFDDASRALGTELRMNGRRLSHDHATTAA